MSSPTEGQLYRAGDTITWNAFARDAAGFDVERRGHQDRGATAPRHPLPPVPRPGAGTRRHVHHPHDGRAVGGHLVRGQGHRDRSKRPVHEQDRERHPAEVGPQPRDLAVRARHRRSTASPSARRTPSPASRASSASSPPRTARSPRTGRRCSSPAGRTASRSGTSSDARGRHDLYGELRAPAAVHGKVLRQHDLLGDTGPDAPGPGHQLRLGERIARPGGARTTASRHAGPRPSGSAPAATRSRPSPTTACGCSSTESA